jgi:hypothetical protein
MGGRSRSIRKMGLLIAFNFHTAGAVPYFTAASYSTTFNASIQSRLMHCHPTFPSELSFCILHVSNFHDVELLMRVVALYNANATSTLAKRIDDQESSGVFVFRHEFCQTKATVP